MGRRFMPHVKQLAMKTRGNQASCLSMKTTAGWDERHPAVGDDVSCGLPDALLFIANTILRLSKNWLIADQFTMYN